MPYALQDVASYNDDLTCTSAEAFAKYVQLVSEYLRLACGARKTTPDELRFRHILVSGLRTLTHVFRLLLLYTRNLDATWYHCQKAAYYYVEFMGQIGSDGNGFLQLNAKDAALFVYKKTLFEINGERRKEFGSVIGNDDRVDNIDTLTSVFSKCTAQAIESVALGTARAEMAAQTSAATLGLSRSLLNLALLGTEAAYRDRLNVVSWFDKSTAGWGAARLLAFEALARKIRSHRPSTTRLDARAAQTKHCVGHAQADPAAYVSWLLGRKARAGR